MSRIAVATRMGFREQARRPLLLVLLVGLPFFFITRAIAATEVLPRQVVLPGDGGQVLTNMRDIHGANMAAITIAFLVGLVGVFVIQSAREADRRLVLAGYQPLEVVIPRLLILAGAGALVAAVSLIVTGFSFSPQRWLPFVVGTLLLGAIYGLLGVLLGAAFGRLGATYLLLFGAMLDIGIVQNPMFGSGEPPGWGGLLPGYGPGRVIVDAAFSPAFHAWSELVAGVVWLLALAGAAAVILRRMIGIRSAHINARGALSKS